MKNQQKIHHDMALSIDGMGIVFYSTHAMKDIAEGEDYFSKEFSTPEQVASHIKKGDITGVNTGSGGEYTLRFRDGYPDHQIDENYPICVRLALEIKGGNLCVIDLFWLMEWSRDCPAEQQIEIEDGIYHVTLSTAQPKSGIWGDDQIIYVYLNKLEKIPKLTWMGVPQLYRD